MCFTMGISLISAISIRFSEFIMINCIAVFFGGGIGAVARYAVSILFARSLTSALTFPLATFVINVLGSFILGFLYAMSVFSGKLPPELHLALTVGCCGAFTTFSTFSLEILNLIRDGAFAAAFLYVLASFAFGLLAVALGFFFAKFLLS